MTLICGPKQHLTGAGVTPAQFLSVVIPCYNAYRLPPPIQFILYLFIGGTAALANLTAFLLFSGAGLPVIIAAPAAFVLAAVVNYILCVLLLFRHKARWGTIKELVLYCLLVVVAGLDLKMTQLFLSLRASAAVAKSVATAAGLIFNCLGRPSSKGVAGDHGKGCLHCRSLVGAAGLLACHSIRFYLG